MVGKIFAFMAVAVVAANGEMSATQVVEENQSRHTLKNETTVMSITLIDRRGNRETRTLRQLYKERNNGLDSSLSVFEKPADVRGTALLTRENEGKDNDQWLYLPSQRRLMRIAQARRNGYFMGTDFTYEDMDPEKIDNYSYRHLREEQSDGADCYVIEAVPVEKHRRSSEYAKRILWIRKDIFFIVRVEFHDRRGHLVKTQANSKLQQVGDRAWRAQASLVDNLLKQHQTAVDILSRDIETHLPDSCFSERHILTGRYLESL